MVLIVTWGQQYNVGEKPTVILCTYINRHAGTPDKNSNPPLYCTLALIAMQGHQTKAGNPVKYHVVALHLEPIYVIVYYYYHV